MRIESAFHPHLPDGRSATSFNKLAALLPEIAECRVLDVYCVDDRLEPDWIIDLVCDPVAQAAHVGGEARSTIASTWTHVIEVAPRPGVTDPVARTLETALRRISGHELPEDLLPSRTAVQYVVSAPGATMSSISACSKALYNPLIQICEIRARGDATPLPDMYPHVEKMPVPAVQTISLDGLSLEDLSKLSTDRLLALEAEEMRAIQAYYARADVQADRRRHGLAEPTDVEIEMLAQTWSEHCKHKIFAAEIRYNGQSIDGLFRTYVAAVTNELIKTRTDTISVFDDNSGVVEFDEDTLVCFKAETHNSPSALDPYGGAITGIVGVNRDILGTGLGARPVFNTNVLCFGDPETPADDVPGMLLHPRRVLDGVHHGIVDGGNQSGIPVVAGAVLFDESYMGKPLVFCGTGGVMPRVTAGRNSWEKAARPGDHAVMVGGRIGKDGIHGATFSSLALDETSPTSAVQIGDPITQKKMIEFLLEARDAGYLSSLTDNGAGGLSSSLGEMARESGGVSVNLDLCPLKYPGLAAWEIWVSESQERMSAAVPPKYLDAFLKLAERHDVEATAIGRFTDSGYIELEHRGSPVCRLEMDFIHNGLPRMRLVATWIPPGERGPWRLGEPATRSTDPRGSA
ncbi:MAG: AIR synthase-related protein, partial [Spirochaetaceae bacterium]